MDRTVAVRGLGEAHSPSGTTCEVALGVPGLRLLPEVILVAVRWIPAVRVSYRDLAQLLAERGIEVDQVSGNFSAIHYGNSGRTTGSLAPNRRQDRDQEASATT
jgi:hypothetical protein